MWCRNCTLETNEKICPQCGNKTEEEMPIEVNWCTHCNIPIIKYVNEDEMYCPICGNKTRHLTSDIRPVFPQERLLIELLLDKEENSLAEKSIWASNSRYYINGKSVSISSKYYQSADADLISKKLMDSLTQIDETQFWKYIRLFINANMNRLNYIKDEAFDFVQKTANKFDEEKIVISFSGEKIQRLQRMW